MSDTYIRPEEACRLLKITTRTLYNWDKKGLLESTRTKGAETTLSQNVKWAFSASYSSG